MQLRTSTNKPLDNAQQLRSLPPATSILSDGYISSCVEINSEPKQASPMVHTTGLCIGTLNARSVHLKSTLIMTSLRSNDWTY